jgi:hypothetical protein
MGLEGIVSKRRTGPGVVSTGFDPLLLCGALERSVCPTKMRNQGKLAAGQPGLGPLVPDVMARHMANFFVLS